MQDVRPTLLEKLVNDTFPVMVYRSVIKQTGTGQCRFGSCFTRVDKRARVEADWLKLIHLLI